MMTYGYNRTANRFHRRLRASDPAFTEISLALRVHAAAVNAHVHYDTRRLTPIECTMLAEAARGRLEMLLHRRTMFVTET